MKRWLIGTVLLLAMLALFWWVAETSPMIPVGDWDWMR